MNIKVICAQIGETRKFHDVNGQCFHTMHVTEIGVLEIHRTEMTRHFCGDITVATFPAGNWMISELLSDDE